MTNGPEVGGLALVEVPCLLTSDSRSRFPEGIPAWPGDIVTLIEVDCQEYDSGGRWVRVIHYRGVGWIFTNMIRPVAQSS